MEIFAVPASGAQVSVNTIDVDFYAMGPDSDLQFFWNGQEQILIDGHFPTTLNLQPGLNQYDLVVSDDEGRSKSMTYNVYNSLETIDDTGLFVELYAVHNRGILPDPDQLQPYATVVNPGSQLANATGENYTQIGDKYLWGGNLVRMRGIMQVTDEGEYRFNVNAQHKLLIDGEFVSAIGADFPGQWDSYNTIYLTPGRHEYEILTYSYWNGPELRVNYAFDGGNEITIPDHVFRHGPSHRVTAKRLATKNAGGGRHTSQLVAEYRFQPGAPFADSSGNGFDLTHDPRAIVRPTGGVTYRQGGVMSSEKGGVFASNEIIESGRFTLEADFVFEGDVIFDWTSKLLTSLSSTRGTYFGSLEVYNDDIRFWVRQSNGNYEMVEAQNVISTNGRYHVVGGVDGGTMRLYINGVLADSETVNVDYTTWANLLTINVGQRMTRHVYDPSISHRQMMGTYLLAAVYARNLSPSMVTDNYQANQSLFSAPGPLPAPTVTAFPPAGTTPAQLAEAHHILNRLTFGPSPDSVADILSMGVDNWINNQLNPAGIDDSELQAVLDSDFFRPNSSEDEFRGMTLYRMIQSKRQLLEVMTQFWDNHFNTQLQKVDNVIEELAENERFRSLALGDFSDLLVASAMNLPMTIYLDNTSNLVGAPNENYGRELFELFSMGVNNGYTQQDIVEAARCFTGWSVRNGTFFFNPGLHDYGEKNVLGITIPAGGGLSDGVQLIQHVVSRAETADFITWKLCQLLIDDDPPADVLAAASTTFQNSGGNILQVLQTILNHARFRTDLAYRGNKVKTPLEFVTSAARVSESYPYGTTMIHYLDDMGWTLFNFAEPTGFAEEGVNWIDTNSLLTRWNFIDHLTSNRGNGTNVSGYFQNYIAKRGLTTAPDLLDFFSDAITFGSESPGVYALAEGWMTDNDPGSFVLTDDVLNNQVRQTFGLFLRLPEFNKQ